MRVCLWGAWYGSRNIGDRALLIALAQELRARVPGIDIVVISKNTGHIRAYMAREGLVVRPMSKIRDVFRIIHAMRHADAFVLGGGVPFYDQWIHVAIMLLLVGMARLFHTPVMTLGVATQKLRSPLSRAVYRRLLNSFASVTVRDPHTFETFRGLPVTRNMRVVGDVALLLKSAPDDQVDRVMQNEGIPANVPLIFVVPRRVTVTQPYSRAHYRAVRRSEMLRMRARSERCDAIFPWRLTLWWI